MDTSSAEPTEAIEKLLRVGEAADSLSVCRSKLYSMMAAGELPYVKLGKSRRIRRSDLAALVDQHTVPARKQ